MKVLASDSAISFSGLGGGASSQVPGKPSPTGNFVPVSGGSMQGALAFNSLVGQIDTTHSIDVTPLVAHYTGYLILSTHAGLTDTLQQIIGAHDDGQFMWIQAVSTETITIKNDPSGVGSGGFNIRTPGLVDYVLKGPNSVLLYFDPVSNQWAFMGSSIFDNVIAGANQTLSNLINPTAINQDLNFLGKNINTLNLLNFKTTGSPIFISTSGDGKVMNFNLGGLANVFNMSVTANGGIFEVLASNIASPPGLKMFNQSSPSAGQTLGTINYDGFVGINQKSYIILSGQVAANGTSGKFVIQGLFSPLGTPQDMFSVDASTGLIKCIGTKLVVESNIGGIPDNPLTIDTLASGGYAAYSDKVGHLFQNDTASKFFFGAGIPNIFYQGIQMITNPRTNSSYVVDSLNGSGTDLIITMSDNGFTRNCTLPDANTFVGRFLIVKNIGSKSVFFVTVGGQTVDGQASGAYTLLGGSFASAILFAEGGNWFVAAKV